MRINNETKIGITVFIVLVLLAAMTIKAGSINFKREGYSIKVQFNDIDGVNLNSPVMFNGYEVGIVNDINIVNVGNKTKMELDLWINQDARLRKGAKAYIKNLGFMGEKYVGLISNDSGASFIPEGSLIVGQEPPKFQDLIVEGKDIAVEVKEVVANINERLKTNSDEVDQILISTKETMQSMSSVVGDFKDVVHKNKKDIDEMISNLSSLSVNLDELSYDLKLHPWKILYKSRDKQDEEVK